MKHDGSCFANLQGCCDLKHDTYGPILLWSRFADKNGNTPHVPKTGQDSPWMQLPNSWDSCIFRKLQLAISAYIARWPCCATPKAQEILSLESRCELTAPCGKVLPEDQGGSKSRHWNTETSLFAVVKKSFHACALFIEGVRVGERSKVSKTWTTCPKSSGTLSVIFDIPVGVGSIKLQKLSWWGVCGSMSSGITCNHFDMYPSAQLQVAMKASAKATKQQFWLQMLCVGKV